MFWPLFIIISITNLFAFLDKQYGLNFHCSGYLNIKLFRYSPLHERYKTRNIYIINDTCIISKSSTVSSDLEVKLGLLLDIPLVVLFPCRWLYYEKNSTTTKFKRVSIEKERNNEKISL